MALSDEKPQFSNPVNVEMPPMEAVDPGLNPFEQFYGEVVKFADHETYAGHLYNLNTEQAYRVTKAALDFAYKAAVAVVEAKEHPGQNHAAFLALELLETEAREFILGHTLSTTVESFVEENPQTTIVDASNVLVSVPDVINTSDKVEPAVETPSDTNVNSSEVQPPVFPKTPKPVVSETPVTEESNPEPPPAS